MKARLIFLTSFILLASPLLNAMECKYETTEEFWNAAEKVYIGTVILAKYDGSTIHYKIDVTQSLKGDTSENQSLKGNFGAYYPLPIAARVIVFESEGTIMACSPSGKIDFKWATTKRADIDPNRIEFAKEIIRLIENGS